MKPSSVLEVGQTYSKKERATLINEPRLLNVIEGVSSCNNSNSYLLFVDLEKEDKEKRFHSDDFTDNANLVNVYRWKPSDAGMTTKSRINRTGSISDENN